jgi:UDPglucose 6-dehydrogenase
MKICVIGGGYVGLVTSVCLSEFGHEITLIEKDPEKLEKLRNKQLPIFEPGLYDYFQRNLRLGNLEIANSLKGISPEMVFVCVGTPIGADGRTDLSQIFAVVDELCASSLDDSTIIVFKSTYPVGTTAEIKRRLKNHGRDFKVAFCPEFLREGSAVTDAFYPDRIVIGCDDDEVFEVLRNLFAPLVRNGNPILKTDFVTAELTKYVANAYLAMRISFINEVANLCEVLGGDINQLRSCVGSDFRIGLRYFYPGAGFGGSCLPKDLTSLISFSRDHDFDFRLARTVLDVNAKQRRILCDKIYQFYSSVNLSDKVFGVWGLSFKALTDDVREASSYYHLKELASRGARFKAFDPEASEKFRAAYPEVAESVEFVTSMYHAVKGVNALLIFTEWTVFRSPNLGILANELKDKIIFDGKNLLDPAQLKKAGLKYWGVGVRNF